MNFNRIVYVSTLAVAMTIAFVPEASAASKYRVLYNFYGQNGFPGPKGGLPLLFAALAIDEKGNLYGTAAGGTGNNCFGPCGVIFEMTRGANGKWGESVAFNFTNPSTQGIPYTALTADGQGNLYGGASGGEQGYLNLLYQLTPRPGGWALNVVEDPGTDVGVITDASGNLFGFLGDGAYDDGGVGELSHAADGWTLTQLYSFCRNGNCSTGVRPLVPMSWDSKGNLYGTTYEGGFSYPQCYCGVAFQLTPNSDGTWTYHRLHVFGSFPSDGRSPYGGLTVDAAGNVYGTTTNGGPNQDGTVFKLTPTSDGRWKETIIYGFGIECNCASPGNNLVFDKAGNLYGTAATFEECKVGGNGCGLVFKLAPQKNGCWKYSLVHLFRGPDGEYPNGLTMDSKGNLYGTTTLGGKYDVGVVFEITP
jgi:uncharacterized repeat protein (TIGR03803 family)